MHSSCAHDRSRAESHAKIARSGGEAASLHRQIGEARLREALAVADEIGSTMSALEAAIPLGALLRESGRPAEARTLIAPIHGAFTEGLSTAPLVTAKQLLDE